MKNEPQTHDPSNNQHYPPTTFDHISYNPSHHFNFNNRSYMIQTPPPTPDTENINPNNLAILLTQLLLCIYRETLQYFPRPHR